MAKIHQSRIWQYLVSILFVSGVFLLLFPFFYPYVYGKGIGIERAGPTSTPTPTIEPLSWPIRLPILMYHYVEYVEDKGDTIRQSLNVTPYTFEAQIKTLVDAGYTFLTAKDVGEMFDGVTNVRPEKSVLLTFDDGYRDFYTDVYPICKKYNVKATVYVIAGFVDYKNYMTEEQLKEISSSGLVDVGAHTVHHVDLKNQQRSVVEQEVTDSKRILEDLLGHPVVSFAYPDGLFDDAAVEAVKNAGFTTSVTVTPGIENGVENRYTLFRLRSGGRTGDALLHYFNQKTFTAW